MIPFYRQETDRGLENLRLSQDYTMWGATEMRFEPGRLMFQSLCIFHHYAILVKCKSLMRQKGTTEDEMVGWHHRLDGHEFEQAPGVGDRQGGLVCWRPWDRKELDTTERLT